MQGNATLLIAYQRLTAAYGLFGPSSRIPGELIAPIGNVHLDLLAVLRLVTLPSPPGEPTLGASTHLLSREARVAAREAFEHLGDLDDALTEAEETCSVDPRPIKGCVEAVAAMRDALVPFVDPCLRRLRHHDGWCDDDGR